MRQVALSERMATHITAATEINIGLQVSEFDHRIDDCVFRFSDFLDGGGAETYTARYLWCLYAIVFGIHQYDLIKQAEVSHEII